jgi:hypothetical protein
MRFEFWQLAEITGNFEGAQLADIAGSFEGARLHRLRSSGFVSGPDFSRAAKPQNPSGFSPCGTVSPKTAACGKLVKF